MKRRWMTGAMAALATAAVASLAGGPATGSALAGGKKGRQGSQGKVAISPQPGTPDASPQTQISILGVKPGKIGKVKVVGDQTGRHSGTKRSYSGKRGASFLLDRPLSQGERVKITIKLDGRKPAKTHFTVANLAPEQPILNLSQRQNDKLHHYVSEPDLVPPKVSVFKRSHETSGKIFLTPAPAAVVHPESDNAISINPVGPGGPMIVNAAGQVVWFKQLAPPDAAGNLNVQTYHGKKVLTWWQGPVTVNAFGLGEGVIANTSYKTIATVEAGNGFKMDIHEFELTPDGDAVFTVYQPILVHLPGTPEGTLSPLMDAIVQEVDVKTGLVVWEWHTYGNIPLSESYATPENSAQFDAFHINSIQPLDGRYLVSARDTSAVYMVDRDSGEIKWTLGGKDSDFKMRPGATFHLQHHVRMLDDGTISLFDDEAGPPQWSPSARGLLLTLNHKRMVASVKASFHRPEDVSVQSEGSVQPQPNGDYFMGYGSEPYFSEFSKKGHLLYDAALPDDDGSYRAFRYGWHGRPKTDPAIAVRREGSGTGVYASWNGATQVRRWQVLAGPASGPLESVETARKKGFETNIPIDGVYGAYKVRALGPSGQVLASSARVPAS